METRAQETRTDRRAAKTNILQHSACWSLIQLPRLIDPGLHRTDASKCVYWAGQGGMCMVKLTHRHFTLNFRHHIQWWWHQEYLTNIAGQGAWWGDGAVSGRVVGHGALDVRAQRISHLCFTLCTTNNPSCLCDVLAVLLTKTGCLTRACLVPWP